MCVSVSSKRLDEAKDQTAESETYLDYDQIPSLFLSLENINVTAGTQPGWSLRAQSLESIAFQALLARVCVALRMLFSPSAPQFYHLDIYVGKIDKSTCYEGLWSGLNELMGVRHSAENLADSKHDVDVSDSGLQYHPASGVG